MLHLTNAEITAITKFNKGTVSRDFKSFQTDGNGKYDIEAIFKQDVSMKIKYFYLIATRQKEQLQSMSEKLTTIKSQLLQSNNDNKKISSELDATKVQLKAANSKALQLNEVTLQLEAAKKNNVATQKELVATKEEFGVAMARANELQKEKDGLQRDIDATKQKLSVTSSDSNERETLLLERCDELQEQLTKLQGTSKVLQGANVKLQEERKELQQQIKRLQEGCNVSSDTAERLQGNNDELQVQVKELQQTNYELQGEVSKLRNENIQVQSYKDTIQVQRKELLGAKADATKDNKIAAFFGSLKMFQFYMVIVIVGTWIVSVIEWREFEVIKNSDFGQVAVYILATVLSTSIVFISFNKSGNKYVNRFVLGVFVYAEFINSAKFTGLFNSEDFGTFCVNLGGTVILPTLSLFVAYLNENSTRRFELNEVTSKLDTLLNKYKISDKMTFKNDLIESLVS